MAAHLTLEEAAEVLGISADDFKKRLKTDPLFKSLDRGKIRDGTSFRFKEPAVAELARELGAGSDPGKNRALGSPATPSKGTPKVKHEEPLKLSNDDEDDVFSLSSDDSKSSGPKTSKFKRSDLPPVQTEEIAIDFSGPASGIHKDGSSTKLSAPRSSTKLSTETSGKNLAKKPPKPPSDDSEFELSLDGGDDAFELKLGPDAGDDEDDAIDLGELPKDVPGGSRVGRGGESGILSRKPNDTGRSLERSKSKDKDPKSGKNPKSGSLPPLPTATGGDGSEADVDFELTLDAGAGVSSSRLGTGSSKSKKKLVTDSDSEFELTLDDSSTGSHDHAVLDDSESEGSKGDIFETDFEIPPMDPSGSEAVVMDSTDTDIEEVSDESGETDETEPSSSEVVLLEDEDEGPKPRGRSSKKLLDEDADTGDVDLADMDLEVDEESAAGALRGVRDTGADEEEEEEELAAAGAGVYRPVPWGIVPLLFLLPAFTLTLIGGLMGFELLQTMWGYQQPRKPGAPLVRSVAQQFDMELKDQ
ncbi:MAG: hypothetical protein K8U57_03335 [Planctomycetes bacterium]|nr:hypothetical protein [Planctomycetota bacterium]